jgi:hypothetical protein
MNKAPHRQIFTISHCTSLSANRSVFRVVYFEIQLYKIRLLAAILWDCCDIEIQILNALQYEMEVNSPFIRHITLTAALSNKQNRLPEYVAQIKRRFLSWL